MAFQVRDYPWLPDPIERGLNWIGARGWLPIVAIGLAVLAFWGFLSIADEVSERETYQFDTRLLEAIGGRYETATGFWREAGRDITALGGSTVITLMVTGVIAFLLLRGHWKSTIFVLVSVLGGLALSLLLKEVYDRPRPEIFEHQSYTHTPSFPSGHSANSAVAYLTMAILLTKLVRRSLMKGYIFFVGLLIPFLVGASRVYLGVHWPTDVAAGCLIGLGWGLVVWGVATFLQRRGGLEPEGIMDADRPGRRRVVQEA